jgi:hypothetical protein
MSWVRKRIATPAFFTIAALADTLGLSLEEIADPLRRGDAGSGRGAHRLTRVGSGRGRGSG